MERAQNIVVGGIYFWKRGRDHYEKVMVSDLVGQHALVRLFQMNDPEDQASGEENRTHKSNLFIKQDVEMAAGRKRKTRRRKLRSKTKKYRKY